MLRVDPVRWRQTAKQLREQGIWDGASYHRAQRIKAAAEVLELELVPLSAYSPDFMPVEYLWQWLREDVTDHTCYDKPSQLMGQVVCFEQRINTELLTIADNCGLKLTSNRKKNSGSYPRRGLISRIIRIAIFNNETE
jgi:hypothetical protein